VLVLVLVLVLPVTRDGLQVLEQGDLFRGPAPVVEVADPFGP
jgi:hypothetical protein